MSAVDDEAAGDRAAVAVEAADDDLYDFSGLSVNDFGLLQKGLMMATAGGLRGAPVTSLSVTRASHSITFSLSGFNGSNAAVGSDDEEWYPPTPPPYDVADKLIEANSRLEADPNSTERIADKIKWRSESSLVEIRSAKHICGRGIVEIHIRH